MISNRIIASELLDSFYTVLKNNTDKYIEETDINLSDYEIHVLYDCCEGFVRIYMANYHKDMTDYTIFWRFLKQLIDTYGSFMHFMDIPYVKNFEELAREVYGKQSKEIHEKQRQKR